MPKFKYSEICGAFSLVLGTLASAPATAQEMAPMLHNGSLMLWTRQQDGHVKIAYETPRPGLPVANGAIMFEGVSTDKGHYSGTAFVFSRTCPPQPYAVAGEYTGSSIVLSGVAPLRDRRCQPIAGTVNRSASRLLFEYEPD